MRGKKCKTLATTKKNILVDIKGKDQLVVTVEDSDISLSEYNEELEKLYKSVAKIQKQQYSKNYMLNHIYSRTFKDIVRIKIDQIFTSIKKAERAKG